MLCPTCGHPNPEAARFCNDCAAALAAPPPVAAAPPPISASFAGGRYRVKRFLGEGGKKKVYLVHDTKLDRDVAFSLIKTAGLDAVGVERIKREARLMGRLGGHPHVVALFDLGEEAGQPYLVSELMGGGDVEGLIEKAPEHRVPIAEALRIADEVCRALEYAHAHGIVHRDLKPGNVWLTQDGTAKLGDLGLAVALDQSRLSVAGMIVGTVAYLPPEQALGRTPDARSDLYSLGVMLYELVAGRPPFLGDDPVAVISQHVSTAPVAPSWHNPSVPKPLEALILGLLEKDPAKRPTSAHAVRAELAAIRASAAPPSTDQHRVAADANPLDRLAGGVFVGREQELDALRAALDGALSGRGAVVLLAGEPGIGKTRLAEELATYAALRGAQVLWGRCDEWEGTPAYWPWVQAIRAYLHDRDAQRLQSELGSGAGEIARVVSEVREKLPGLPEPPHVEGEQARFRLFDAVASFLKHATTAQPLMLVLDDLHWADASSLLLLRFVVRELRASRLLVIGIYRDVEVGRHHPLAQTLAELVREPRMQRLLLRGLREAEVARYLTLTTGREAPEAMVAAIERETEGNPFFVTEVVRLLASEGRLDRAAAGTWSETLPQGVREVVGRRLDRLSEPCNRALGAAAVIGREFALEVLARVLDLPTADLLDHLAEAEQARLIRAEGPGRYRFAQELTQETLASELSPSQRVRLHAKVGEALEALYAADLQVHAAELAYHFGQAALAGTHDKAIAYARQAGDRALTQLGYEEAAGHYARALQAMDLAHHGDDHDRCALLLGLGQAQRGAGHPDYRVTFLHAANLARKLGASELLAQAALGLGGEGYTTWGLDAELIHLLEEALEVLGPGDSVLRVRLLARLAIALSSQDHDRLGALSLEAEAMARRLGDPNVLAAALHVRYLDVYRRSSPLAVGAIEAVLTAADESVRAADATGDAERACIARTWRLFSLLSLGDMAGIDAALEDVAERAENLRQPFYQTTGWHLRALRALIAGRFSETEQYLEKEEDIAPRVRDPIAAWGRAALWFHLRREQGRVGEVEAALQALLAEEPDRPPSFRAFLALLYAETGREAAARAEVARFAADNFALLDRWRYQSLDWIHGCASLGEVCALLGGADHAEPLYERLMPFATRNLMVGGGMQCWGSASHFLGLLATTLGRWDAAAHHFEDALAMNERLQAPPFVARSQYAYADMLVRQGEPSQRDRSMELVGQALATAESLGMAKLAEQALALKVQVQGILKA